MLYFYVEVPSSKISDITSEEHVVEPAFVTHMRESYSESTQAILILIMPKKGVQIPIKTLTG